MRTVDDIIEALGGTAAVAERNGLTEPAVSNWRKRGIPARWSEAIRADLRKLGIESVPPRLFGMEGSK